MHNGVKEAAKQPALWVPIFGLINPVVAGIGIIGLTAYFIIKKINKSAPERERLLTVKEPLNKPLPDSAPTVGATVAATVHETLNGEEIKKELIRQAMSELGKRSGRARARKL